MLYPSSDLRGKTATKMAASRYYIYASREISLILEEMFRKSFPDFYRTHKKAFEAGKWYAEAEGAWLGLAIVYKLQTNSHIDKSDGNYPVAIFCLGQYEGGFLDFPDLNLRFK